MAVKEDVVAMMVEVAPVVIVVPDTVAKPIRWGEPPTLPVLYIYANLSWEGAIKLCPRESSTVLEDNVDVAPAVIAVPETVPTFA